MQLKEMSVNELSETLKERRNRFESYRVNTTNPNSENSTAPNKYEAIIQEKLQAIAKQKAEAKIEPVVVTETVVELEAETIAEQKVETTNKEEEISTEAKQNVSENKKKGFMGLFKQKATTDNAQIAKEKVVLDQAEKQAEVSEPESSKEEKNKDNESLSGAVEATKSYNTRMKAGYFGKRRR